MENGLAPGLAVAGGLDTKVAGLARAGVGLNRVTADPPPSREDPLHHMRFLHSGEALIETAELEAEASVIDP